MTAPACERVRELAPELALGIADGEERAMALAHLAECPDCRAHLESLATVADELLLLAPEEEPPVGFEERVAARISPLPAPDRPRRRRFSLAFAGLASAAALAAAAVWVGTASDRDLASHYREALDTADGSYFAAFKLEAPGGRDAGDVFAYEGHPSWAFVVASPPETYPDGGVKLEPGRYTIELAGPDGERMTLATMTIAADGTGSGGGALPDSLDRFNELRMLDPAGREIAEAQL